MIKHQNAKQTQLSGTESNNSDSALKESSGPDSEVSINQDCGVEIPLKPNDCAGYEGETAYDFFVRGGSEEVSKVDLADGKEREKTEIAHQNTKQTRLLGADGIPDFLEERRHLIEIIRGIEPYDELEAVHIESAIGWISTTCDVYRREKPATPPKHMVSYCILLDPENSQILLGDHLKSELWLPGGGHIDPGEDPKAASEREFREELGLEPDFVVDEPFFITQTETVGPMAGHTDVSLWYLLRGDSSFIPEFDNREFKSLKWFHYDEIDYSRTDIHMERFISKLRAHNIS